MKFPHFLTLVLTGLLALCIYKGIPFSFLIEGAMPEVNGRIKIETGNTERDGIHRYSNGL